MSGSAATQRARRLSERQHGNISFAQLRAAGLSTDQIEQRSHSGWLVRRHHLVYAVGHVPRSRESRWHAATLALGDGAVLSHRAAGALLGIVSGSVPTEVTVAPTVGHPHRDGIIVHRAHMPGRHRRHYDQIAVTTPVRTLLDLAAVLDLRRLADAFEEAQITFGLAPVSVAVEVAARPGHRGSGRLRTILCGAVDPADVCSRLELRFLGLCQRHGLPCPVVNRRVGAWRPDFAWPDAMLIVETDGGAFHRTVAKRRRDAAKDADLIAGGWQVLRLDWDEVTDAAPLAAARVAAALDVRAAGRRARPLLAPTPSDAFPGPLPG